ncbi:Mitochondrial fission protein ELM1 [Phytophthora palmivora]|uniref:Mitochondrial fission protein ELM1 n=1 Tax=Phytophthora palmivora TaxID=4796 RepID=A0A2P4X7Q4_9STRA|nr:Mitochondrial fission protein ELM1 [Phytophthora palmivora]
MVFDARRYVVRLLVLGNGAAGAEKQALALGARLREKLLEKSVSYRSNVSCSPVECVRVSLGRSHIIPPVLQVFGAKVSRNPLFGYREQDTSRLFPAQKDAKALDVVIGCGRSTVALCAVMKWFNRKKTFNVQIQHPRVPLTWFDAVVVPRHDFPRGEGGVNNLFLTTGTVHDITPELLQQHEGEWREEFDEKLQGRQTRVVWLLGGPCRGFSFTDQDAERMVDEFLLALPDSADAAVLVTFSRRTPQNVQRIVRRGLAAKFLLPGQLLVWKGTESRNPYYALLSTASCVVTTPDSISMTTEAIASGKPVFTIGVENCKGKFLRFHQSLFASKTTAPLTADAIATALLRKHDVSSYASAALEKEIALIVDDIATDIRGVLKQLESE